MRNRGHRKPILHVFGTPGSLLAQIEPHLAWLEAKNYKPVGVGKRRRILENFCLWCEERGIDRPEELRLEVFDLYQRHLSMKPKANGELLSPHTQAQKLSALKRWCQWMVRQRLIDHDPSAQVELPRMQTRLPRAVLTLEEVERIMAQPDLETLTGLRDRTMLEVLFSTGIRRSELCRLRLNDLDAGRGVIAVRQGKGDKDRFVPVGERALAWLAKYRNDSRPRLSAQMDDGTLFLSADGTAINPEYFGNHVRRILDEVGIDKPGACHLFRHTAATLMLEGGADIRYIQQFLGHASMATTQIYTRVSLHQLKAVHAACHPGARLKRDPSTD
jgi:integrase/recombinase XerD